MTAGPATSSSVPRPADRERPGVQSVPVTLRAGTAALSWPLLPTHARDLRDNHATLSADSRCSRFLTGAAALTDRLLRVLVDDVDEVDHVARVLMAFSQPQPETARRGGPRRRLPELLHGRGGGGHLDGPVAGSGRGQRAAGRARRWAPGRGRRTAYSGHHRQHRFLARLARPGAVSTHPAGPEVLDVHVPLPPVPSNATGAPASSGRPAGPRSDDRHG